MVQKHIAGSVIAPIVVASILMLSILAAVSSANHVFAYSSYKSYKSYYKSSKYTKHGNVRASNTRTAEQGASNTGNAAQGASNLRSPEEELAKPESGKSCALTLNVSPTTIKASSYNINGRLTCGGSGVSGSSIKFTTLYYGKINGLGNAVTGSDGSFSQTTTAWSNSVLSGSVVAHYAGDSEHRSTNSKIIQIQGGTAQGASNANTAQGASNTGQGGPSAQTSVGNVGQGTSSQAGHCKPAISLSAQWYPPYRNYMIRGTLTCGGSGLGGKTITLTSSKLSYVGALGTVVTGEDGSFSKSYKPASTAKPFTTVSAWFLGAPDEGGIASKVVTPQGGPQSSNTASTPQESSNNGNTAQGKGASNTGNGAENSNTGNGGQRGTGQGS
jgi:hypothetical protein